jgi:hypothetical protein
MHVVLLTLALASPARHRCEDVLANVRRKLAQPAPIALGAADECEDEIAAAKDMLTSRAASMPDAIAGTGDLDGTRAAVVATGPNGSGHFWNVGIAVGAPPLVACVTTSTAAWRNIGGNAAVSKLFPRFDPLAVPHRFTLWTNINSLPPNDEGRDIAPSLLLLPMVFRLAGERLEVDLDATKRELRAWGDRYARAAAGKDDFAALHRAAAAAYRAFAEGTDCARP